MALSRILPEFGTRAAQGASVSLSEVSLEEQKLASYEAGYQAGWDDSTKANSDAGNQVSADFAQNIRDLSMTYHEAYAALMKDVRPFLLQVVEAVLPAMARDTLAPRILELVEAEMAGAPRSAVVLHAAPDDSAFLQPLVGHFDDGLDLTLRLDETLASGQVRLSFDEGQELELDTTALLDGIQAALHGFFEAQAAPAPDADMMKETA